MYLQEEIREIPIREQRQREAEDEAKDCAQLREELESLKCEIAKLEQEREELEQQRKTLNKLQQ